MAKTTKTPMGREWTEQMQALSLLGFSTGNKYNTIHPLVKAAVPPSGCFIAPGLLFLFFFYFSAICLFFFLFKLCGFVFFAVGWVGVVAVLQPTPPGLFFFFFFLHQVLS